MEQTKRLPIRIALTEKALRIAKQKQDGLMAQVCRKILWDYTLGRKSEAQHFQKVYGFIEQHN